MAKLCNISASYTDVTLTKCARDTLKLDSVQFTHHNEWIFKYEVLDTRNTQAQSSGCPQPEHAALFTRGWGGTKPCACDPSFGALYCLG